jgi:hypothetical protein
MDMPVKSQCDKILEILQTGRTYTAADLHVLVGPCRLNSRVAELRQRGHNIHCVRDGKPGSGPEHYLYTLIPLDTAPAVTPPCLAVGAVSSGDGDIASAGDGVAAHFPIPGQLTLDEMVA